MASILKDLGIDRLSIDQRLDLMHEIWESISAEDSQCVLTDAEKNELQTRLAEDIAFPNDVVAWEEVKAEAVRRSAKP